MSYNPAAEVARRRQEGQFTPSSQVQESTGALISPGSKYSSINLDEGKSSAEFMKQLEAIKSSSNEAHLYAPTSKYTS